MPESKPSYFSSTLSQLAVASMGAYLIGCFALIVGGGWLHKNADIAMKGYDGLRWAVEALVIGYLARSTSQPKNGSAEELPKPEVKP